jgi:hypothetical protein
MFRTFVSRNFEHYSINPDNCSESWNQIHSPRLEDIVYSGIGLSYRLASLCSLHDNNMPEFTFDGIDEINQ